jgi:signal transduction histidine kinase
VRNTRVATTPSIAATGSGLGLAGMRERVAAAGGSVVAHPDGGEYWLRATLPRGAAAPQPTPEQALRQLSAPPPEV